MNVIHFLCVFIFLCPIVYLWDDYGENYKGGKGHHPPNYFCECYTFFGRHNIKFMVSSLRGGKADIRTSFAPTVSSHLPLQTVCLNRNIGGGLFGQVLFRNHEKHQPAPNFVRK